MIKEKQEAKKMVDNLQKELNGKEHTISELQTKLDILQVELNNLEAEQQRLKEYPPKYEALEKQIIAQNKAHEEEILVLKKNISELKEKIEHKNDIFKDLNEKIESSESQIIEHKEAKNEANETIERLKKELEEKSQALEEKGAEAKAMAAKGSGA